MTLHLKVVEIEWVDTVTHGDSFLFDDAVKMAPLPTKSTGYLITEDDSKIVLAQTLFHESDISPFLVKGLIVIPKGCVMSVVIRSKEKSSVE